MIPLTRGCFVGAGVRCSIVPGIAGHTGNDYIKNFIHYCKEDGYNVVSYNWPGCGEHTLTVRIEISLHKVTDPFLKKIWRVGLRSPCDTLILAPNDVKWIYSHFPSAAKLDCSRRSLTVPRLTRLQC